MGLVNAQTVIQQSLDGLHTVQMSGASVGPISAYIAPPQIVIETATAPQVYVWGGRGVTAQHTAPRTTTHSGGFKRTEWEIEAFVFFVDSATPSDVVFPMILDSIRFKMETVAYPQSITDPNTAQVTQFVDIAQTVHMDVPPPEALVDNESNLLYTARFMFRCLEDTQA